MTGYKTMLEFNKTHSNIRFRILAPVITVLVFFTAIGVYSAYSFFLNQQAHHLEAKIQRLNFSFNKIIDRDARQISGLISIILRDKKIKNAWKSKNRDSLLLAARQDFLTFNQAFDITHFYFHDQSGVNFLRVHHPDRHSDKIQRITLSQAIASQQSVYGLELGVFGQFVLRVVEPWYIDDVLVGYIELGKEVDSIIKDLKNSVGIEQVVFINKKRVNKQDWDLVFGEQARWSDFKKWVMATSTTALPKEALQSALAKQGDLSRPVKIEGLNKKYIATKVSLTDMGGNEVGFSLLLHDHTLDNIRLDNIIKNLLVISFFLIVLVASAYFIYIGRIQTTLLSNYKALKNKVIEHQAAEEDLRKSRDALKVSNEELESYSYSIAHDLRTPLRSITSFSQIIKDDERDKLSDDSRNNLNRIIMAGKKMSRLIEDILNLSRITRKELTCQEIDISSIVNEFKDRFIAAHPDRSIEWIIQEDIRVQADARLIERVMEHLLGNAVKYSEGIEHPRIEFGRIKDSEEAIYFVRDNGVGFDMQYSEKLFGTFQRLHGEGYEGTGVGLAMVQRIIHRHGGKVWAEAEVDKGAKFYFTLGR